MGFLFSASVSIAALSDLSLPPDGLWSAHPSTQRSPAVTYTPSIIKRRQAYSVCLLFFSFIFIHQISE